MYLGSLKPRLKIRMKMHGWIFSINKLIGFVIMSVHISDSLMQKEKAYRKVEKKEKKISWKKYTADTKLHVIPK